MNINISGKYCFEIPVQTMFLNEKLIIKGHNLITVFGEAFFLNRWINNDLEPIRFIVLGKGTRKTSKNDKELASETIRKQAMANVNIPLHRLELTADFTVSEIVECSEIGTSNGEVLISRDLFSKIPADITPNSSDTNVKLTYIFSLISGSVRGNWKQSAKRKDIYYINEPVAVKGVFEANTGSGYKKCNSIEEMTAGSYFYNTTNQCLYIQTLKGTDPNTEEIIVDN